MFKKIKKQILLQHHASCITELKSRYNDARSSFNDVLRDAAKRSMFQAECNSDIAECARQREVIAALDEDDRRYRSELDFLIKHHNRIIERIKQ